MLQATTLSINEVLQPLRKTIAQASNVMGDSAIIQPGHVQEILLHETAVAWIRWRLTQCTRAACWQETPAQYTSRIKKLEISKIHRGRLQ